MMRKGNTMEFKENEQGLPRDNILLVDAYKSWEDGLSVTGFISLLESWAEE